MKPNLIIEMGWSFVLRTASGSARTEVGLSTLKKKPLPRVTPSPPALRIG